MRESKFLQQKLLVLLLGIFLVTSCKDKPEVAPTLPDNTIFKPDDLQATDNSTPNFNITWENTAQHISHKVYSAEYGRMHRVKGDTLLTYHFEPQNSEWDNIAIK